MSYKLIFENFRNYLSEEKKVIAGTAEIERDLEGQRILLIGDSQVAGHMGRQLERQLSARGATVLRLGHTGSGARYWNNLLSGTPVSQSKRRQVVDLPNGRTRWVISDRKTWKSQIDNFAPTSVVVGSLGGNDRGVLQNSKYQKHGDKPVSYTHLTLPTIYSV